MTDQKVDMGNEINNEVPDIYHDPDNMILLARIADGLSWLFLVLFVVVIGIIGYMAYYSYVNHLAKEQFIFTLPSLSERCPPIRPERALAIAPAPNRKPTWVIGMCIWL